MGRHRTARTSGGVVPAVVVPGVVAAATGLVLLLVPGAPLAARTGTVLEGPTTPSSATAAPAADGATPRPDPSSTATPQAAAGAEGGSVPTVPLAAEAPAGTPVPLTVRTGFVPDRVVVESLGVDAQLLVTLVDADGALVPPEDPGTLGWWRGVRPGAGAGSVVVAGHVDSTRFGRGPLARLVELVPGDRAVLTGADGARVEYEVRGVQTFEKEALPAAELFGTDGGERLVLVTCGGTFDRARGAWDSNIVAVLDPVAA